MYRVTRRSVGPPVTPVNRMLTESKRLGARAGVKALAPRPKGGCGTRPVSAGISPSRERYFESRPCTESYCDGCTLRPRYSHVTGGLNTQRLVTFDSDGRMLGDQIEVGVRVDKGRAMFHGRRRDHSIWERRRDPLTPKSESEFGGGIPGRRVNREFDETGQLEGVCLEILSTTAPREDFDADYLVSGDRSIPDSLGKQMARRVRQIIAS